MKMLKFIGLIRALQTKLVHEFTHHWYFFFVMTWGNICYVTRLSFLANKISIDPLGLS